MTSDDKRKPHPDTDEERKPDRQSILLAFARRLAEDLDDLFASIGDRDPRPSPAALTDDAARDLRYTTAELRRMSSTFRSLGLASDEVVIALKRAHAEDLSVERVCDSEAQLALRSACLDATRDPEHDPPKSLRPKGFSADELMLSTGIVLPRENVHVSRAFALAVERYRQAEYQARVDAGEILSDDARAALSERVEAELPASLVRLKSRSLDPRTAHVVRDTRTHHERAMDPSDRYAGGVSAFFGFDIKAERAELHRELYESFPEAMRDPDAEEVLRCISDELGHVMNVDIATSTSYGVAAFFAAKSLDERTFSDLTDEDRAARNEHRIAALERIDAAVSTPDLDPAQAALHRLGERDEDEPEGELTPELSPEDQALLKSARRWIDRAAAPQRAIDAMRSDDD